MQHFQQIVKIWFLELELRAVIDTIFLLFIAIYHCSNLQKKLFITKSKCQWFVNNIKAHFICKISIKSPIEESRQEQPFYSSVKTKTFIFTRKSACSHQSTQAEISSVFPTATSTKIYDKKVSRKTKDTITFKRKF